MITATAAIRQDAEQHEPGEVGVAEEAGQRARSAADDAREDDEADAVADPLLGDQLAQPHQDDRARGEGHDLGQRLPAAEVERRLSTPLALEEREEPVRLEERHRHRQVAGVLVDLLAAVLALALERLERRDHARSSAA